MNRSPYEQGRAARRNGCAAWECPYVITAHGERATEWLRGWSEEEGEVKAFWR